MTKNHRNRSWRSAWTPERVSRTAVHKSGITALWGLRSDMVVRNTFPEKLTHKLVIDRMRNALSHPTYGDVGHKYPVSGFKNINDSDGNIWGFSFVDSPDIKHEGSVESFGESDKGRKLAAPAPSDVAMPSC